MYRNLHGSGDMDAEVDAICTKGRGSWYRFIVNSTLKIMKVVKDALHDFGLKIFYICGNGVSFRIKSRILLLCNTS